MVRLSKFRFFSFLFFFFLLFFIAAKTSHTFNIAQEYELKASYIYNFLNFVSFPASQQKDSIEMCVAGENPFEKKIINLFEKNIDGKKIIVSEKAIDDSLKSCNVIFIQKNQHKNVLKILEIIHQYPILTIAESAGSSEQGVVLNFYIENERLRFEINIEAVKKAGLTVDPRLLNLAKIIKPKE